MKRRILQLPVLTAVMIFLLTGCFASGSGQNSDAAETGESSESTGATDPESDLAAWE